jgi:DNA-binding beta-propeller fold protein YncE
VLDPKPQELELPGSPIGLATTKDGRYVFAALAGSVLNGIGPGGDDVVTTEGIAVVKQGPRKARLVRVVELGTPVIGVTLTPDGRYLLATAVPATGQDSVRIIDVRKAIAGASDLVVAEVSFGDAAGLANVRVSPDGRYAYVSLEQTPSGKLAVIDLARAIATEGGAGSVLASVDVGSLPVGLAISRNSRYLYATVQQSFNVGGSSCSGLPQGAVLVVRTRLLRDGAADPVVREVPSGCQPVRLVQSSDGKVLWVSARASGQIYAFSTRKLRRDPAAAVLSRTPVGKSPVGVQLFDGGRLLAVANSNRTQSPRTGTLSILDTRKALAGAGPAATLLNQPAGEFPRELALSPDGTHLYLGQYDSNILAIFDVDPRTTS